MYFSYLYVKSELVEQQRHKVVPVMSIEFDLLLLVSLQWLWWFLKKKTFLHLFHNGAVKFNITRVSKIAQKIAQNIEILVFAK